MVLTFDLSSWSDRSLLVYRPVGPVGVAVHMLGLLIGGLNWNALAEVVDDVL